MLPSFRYFILPENAVNVWWGGSNLSNFYLFIYLFWEEFYTIKWGLPLEWVNWSIEKARQPCRSWLDDLGLSSISSTSTFAQYFFPQYTRLFMIFQIFALGTCINLLTVWDDGKKGSHVRWLNDLSFPSKACKNLQQYYVCLVRLFIFLWF